MIDGLRFMIWCGRVALTLLSAFWLLPSVLHAQGSLTPPGPPAPTMKSLGQIEPRTPITNAAAFTISQPGSYYLTTNVSVNAGDAITIATTNVALDLDGFTISSTETSPTGTGILINEGLRNIVIANGFIQGFVIYAGGQYLGSGFGNGIFCAGVNTPAANVRVSNVSVSGCLFDGINLQFNSTQVESCTVWSVGGRGIGADGVLRCTVYQSGMNGISANTISDCSSYVIGNAWGMSAMSAHNCYGESTGNGLGIYANTADNCWGTSVSGYGLLAISANHCYGNSGNSVGLYSTTASDCYGYGGSEGLSSMTAQNCYGYGTFGGLGARVAQNCYGNGLNYTGLSADTAINCIGETSSSYPGLDAQFSAVNCYGRSTTNGIGLRCLNGMAIGCYGRSTLYVGLNAYIANSCAAAGSPPFSLSFKYNMP